MGDFVTRDGGTLIPHLVPSSPSDGGHVSRRYVVTELEGFSTAERTGGSSEPGLSVQVLDTLVNYRIAGAWRSEDYGGSERGRRIARERADDFVALREGRIVTTQGRTWRFRPTCPRCSLRNAPDAVRCVVCGEALV